MMTGELLSLKKSVVLIIVFVTAFFGINSLIVYGEESSGSDRNIQFHSITSFDEIVKGKHYIFAVEKGNDYYALAYDSETNYCRKLSGVSKQKSSDSSNDAVFYDYTYNLPAEELDSDNCVMNLTSIVDGKYMQDVYKFATNFKEKDTDKKIYLKMGKSSGTSYDPSYMFDTAAGQIELYQMMRESFSVEHDVFGKLKFYESDSGPSFGYNAKTTYKNEIKNIIILSDVTEEDKNKDPEVNPNPGNDLKPPSESEITGIQPFQYADLTAIKYNTGTPFVMLFKDSTGKNYAITPDGIVAYVEADSNKLLMADTDDSWVVDKTPEEISDEFEYRICVESLKRGDSYIDTGSMSLVSGSATPVSFQGGIKDDSGIHFFFDAPLMVNNDGKFMAWDEEASAAKWVDDYNDATPVEFYRLDKYRTKESYHRVNDLSGITDWKKIQLTYTDDNGEVHIILPSAGSSKSGVETPTLPEASSGGLTVVLKDEDTLDVPYLFGINVGSLTSDKSNKYKLTGLTWNAINRALYPDGYVKNESLIYGTAKECMLTYAGDNSGIIIRGAKNWLVYDEEGNLATTTDQTAAGKFQIWALDKPDRERVEVVYHDNNKKEIVDTKTMENIALLKLMDETKDSKEYSFIGWTSDPDKSGYLSLDDSCNMYDYDDAKKLASIKPEIAKKLDLLGPCNPEKDNIIDPSVYAKDGVLNLYPVYAVKAYATVTTADTDGTKIVGIADYKDFQNDKELTEENDKRQTWLGKVYCNVYKDGEIWAESQPMYFRYHNDDAADVSIKFISDEMISQITDSDDPLFDFMEDMNAFPDESQKGSYKIEAVYASQGGSEDGLKYKYNHIGENGGVLDNVQGGSTIDVYVSTCYQVKYYKNDKLLTGKEWTDGGLYSTPGTSKAFAAKAKDATYQVKMDNENAALMDGSITDDSCFTDERLLRGEYSDFAYHIKERPDTFTTAVLPDASEGKKLTDTSWQLKDENGNVALRLGEKYDFALTGTSYGTGNTIYSYTGYSDMTNTYHLYVYEDGHEGTVPGTDGGKSGGSNSDASDESPATGDEFPAMLWLMMIIASLTVIIATVKFRRNDI